MSTETPRFASDERGVFALGTFGASARDLRALAEASEAIAKSAGDRRLVLAHEECEEREAVRLAKLLVADEEKRVLSLEDAPGLAKALEETGVYVWKIAGAEGSLFASAAPPLPSARLVPISKQADFPAAKPRKATLLRKSAEDLGDRQIVYGIVLEPEVTDSQGDVYSATEIELACHRYLEEFSNVGHMHETLINQSAAVVESYIAPCDFEMGGQPVRLGTWVIAVHVLNEDLWGQVKSGDLTGFSIGGYAQRIPVE